MLSLSSALLLGGGAVAAAQEAAAPAGELRLERGVEGEVALYDAEGALVAEIAKPGEDAMELGLEPGPYIVLLRRGVEVLRAEIEVASGEATLLVQTALRPLVEEAEGAPEPEAAERGEGAQSSWDLGLLLASGDAESALPGHPTLELQSFGIEARGGSFVAQVRGRIGSTPWWEEGGAAEQEGLIGADLGALAHWAPWSWLALRAGGRLGVDLASRDLEGDDLWVVVRGGPVGQVMWRPLGWLGVYLESSADLFLDGTVTGGGQLGLTFYVD